jgi:hypothetical protein
VQRGRAVPKARRHRLRGRPGVHPLGGCRNAARHRCFGGNRDGGLPMVRRLLDGEEPWAYENRGSVLQWAQDHVVLAVAAAVTIWFGVIYVMTLVAGLFS